MITRIYFWKVANRNIAWAVSRMALDRLALSGNPSIEFWKLLGAGKGETFTPRDADPNRWGLLIRIDERQLSNFENSALMNRWRDKSTSSFSATLRTISSHGKWSRREPFHSEIEQREWNGAVAAITRARIKTLKNFTFWRSVPPVTVALHQSPGLISAIGIGEAPIGLQGTFSIWQDSAAIRDFAYRGQAHRAAIEATERERWYAEELFARFALIDAQGDI